MGSSTLQSNHLVILPVTWNFRRVLLEEDVYVLKEQGYSDAGGSVHIVFYSSSLHKVIMFLYVPGQNHSKLAIPLLVLDILP